MMEDGETRTVTLSYRDKLLGYNGCGQAFEEDPEEFAKDQEFVYGDDYIGEALKEKQSKVSWPIILISGEERSQLCNLWKRTLIINLLGKTVNFRFLQARLNKLWSGCQFYLVDIPNNHYLVRFADDKDYEHVLQDGPWVIAEHYLVVQRWRPGFNPYDNSVGKMAIWFRIPSLPIEYYEKHYLWRIGNYIGRTLKVDANHLQAPDGMLLDDAIKRGRFARLCVEVDFCKKLVSKVQVTEHLLSVESGGLHLICFGCGKFGHRKEACSNLVRTHTEPTDMENTVPVQMPESSGKVSVNFNSKPDRPVIGEEDFDPWMLAKKLAQRRHPSPNQNPLPAYRDDVARHLNVDKSEEITDIVESHIYENQIYDHVPLKSITVSVLNAISNDKGKSPMIEDHAQRQSRGHFKSAVSGGTPKDTLSAFNKKTIQKKRKETQWSKFQQGKCHEAELDFWTAS